jgi:hypothetical protein
MPSTEMFQGHRFCGGGGTAGVTSRPSISGNQASIAV